MTTIYVRRVGNALFPDGDESIAEMVKLPFNRSLRSEIKQQRNPAFHRLFWALCARIGNGIGKDSETIATVFKYATGHYDTVRSKSYGELRIPKSISFAKLDEAGFRTFFEECVSVCYTEWGIDPATVADLLTPQEVHSRETPSALKPTG